MSTPYYPTQAGYIPTGNASLGALTSTYVLGRTQTGTYEGIGFGAGGRPDYLQVAQINLANRNTDGTWTQKGTITMNVSDLVAIAGLPTNLNLTLKEVQVCESSQTKKMIILASQTYT